MPSQGPIFPGPCFPGFIFDSQNGGHGWFPFSLSLEVSEKLFFPLWLSVLLLGVAF